MHNKDLDQELMVAFERQGMPPVTALVRKDGYDELEKESALEYFANKKREEVAQSIGNSLEGIEELFVLDENALHYYVLPYLRHLVSPSNSPESDFSSLMGFTLNEVIRVRGAGIFSPAQRAALTRVAAHMLDALTNYGDDEWVLSIRAEFQELQVQSSA